ncbi:hypothetical protein [Natrinema sp. J7-2]|uniref:hypothetical protein n=1 Tax=Natrinema sp. (strain J7-2) TaxID=406552 RepID=UPI00026D4EB0|nr:hypothetical protein [Natrinema sp. J7-2]AFO58016.1 hypothetical protein NJ7G_2788 [Natrinema sp. J7-2]
MERRDLLTTVTGSALLLSAGCLSNSSQTRASDADSSQSRVCDAVEITRASVSVDFGCGAGPLRSGSVEGQAGDCNEELILEMVDEDETIEEVPFETNNSRWSVGFGEGPGQVRTIPSPGDKRVRIRGPEREILASEQLTVSHYLDAPTVNVWRPEFEPKTVSVSEDVTVRFSIATFGAGTAFTAILLVDGEAVETRDGRVDSGTDCQHASGPEYEFSYTFEEPGEHELAGRITVDGSSKGGHTRSIGTVTVTQ